MKSKKESLILSKSMTFCVNDKLEIKLKRLMKKLKLKSMSEAIRYCIENC